MVCVESVINQSCVFRENNFGVMLTFLHIEDRRGFWILSYRVFLVFNNDHVKFQYELFFGGGRGKKKKLSYINESDIAITANSSFTGLFKLLEKSKIRKLLLFFFFTVSSTIFRQSMGNNFLEFSC